MQQSILLEDLRLSHAIHFAENAFDNCSEAASRLDNHSNARLHAHIHAASEDRSFYDVAFQ